MAAALRSLTGRGARRSASPDGSPPDKSAAAAKQPDDDARRETPRPSTSGEEAAARIDAARERLQATIAVPDDDYPDPDGA